MARISKEALASMVGQRLKELRKATTDLGQKDVAIELGITKQAMSGYESGRHMPDISILVDLADFYSCSVDYLLGREETVKQVAANYSERSSVNDLLHALENVAEDEGDYMLESFTEIIAALSLSKGNPQRRNFIECIGELFGLLAEYIEASTVGGKHLSGKATTEDVAIELARISGFDDISETIDDFRRAGIAAIISFSVNARKALRLRTGWRTAHRQEQSIKRKEYEKRFTALMDKED